MNELLLELGFTLQVSQESNFYKIYLKSYQTNWKKKSLFLWNGFQWVEIFPNKFNINDNVIEYRFGKKIAAKYKIRR